MSAETGPVPVLGPVLAPVPESGAMSWRERIDRLVASARFRAFATRFPLTRPVAVRRSKALFDLVAGFVHSQILLAVVRTGLVEAALERPRTLEEIASLAQLPLPAADRLVRACIGIDILEARSGERFGLGRMGAALADNPGVVAMIEHHTALYEDLRDPLALLRGEIGETALGGYWPYVRRQAEEAMNPELAERYSTLMARSQEMMHAEILDAYPFARARCILDVGGGSGAFLSALAPRAPSAQLMLFDLPEVADTARRSLAARDLDKRIEVIGGDFLADGLPQGADVATLVRILFDHPDSRALAILKAVRAALAPDGALVIAEPVSGLKGAERIADTYFGFYLLAMGQGRTRSQAEHTAMLRMAGFGQVRLIRTRMPHLVCLIEARP